jgi:hypothetical protein
MVDYLHNCKRQERTADNANHISMHGCTSQHCWWLASRRSGTQSPNQGQGPCWWQKIMMTMTSDKSWQRTMLRRCTAKLTEKCTAYFLSYSSPHNSILPKPSARGGTNDLKNRCVQFIWALPCQQQCKCKCMQCLSLLSQFFSVLLKIT